MAFINSLIKQKRITAIWEGWTWKKYCLHYIFTALNLRLVKVITSKKCPLKYMALGHLWVFITRKKLSPSVWTSLNYSLCTDVTSDFETQSIFSEQNKMCWWKLTLISEKLVLIYRCSMYSIWHWKRSLRQISTKIFFSETDQQRDT